MTSPTFPSLVELFERAVVAESWKGAGDPENMYQITRRYHIAKKQLLAAMGFVYTIPEDEQ